jgi:zona occludens toxin (predicted ATPase)
MNKAMVDSNNALFKTTLRCFCSHQDIIILDECRTIVPSGTSTKGVGDLIEVDTSEAFYKRVINIQRNTSFQRI